MATDRGRLILLLASHDVQTAKQLASASTLSLAEVTRQLETLITQGFIIASDAGPEPALYRLRPKRAPADTLESHNRVLILDDDATLLELVVAILEDEDYAVVAATTPADGVAVLSHATFDVVITDGFCELPYAVLTTAAEVLEAAEATPVALFSAHRIPLDDVQAAGFRTLIQKPFDIDELLAVLDRCRLQAV
jgi:CheY-like chemotaxis protein